MHRQEAEDLLAGIDELDAAGLGAALTQYGVCMQLLSLDPAQACMMAGYPFPCPSPISPVPTSHFHCRPASIEP